MSTIESNTTFDPMDWYKKLTLCLANKKNCKINLSRIPGGKEIKENKRLPARITNQHLQDKFLAKYNEKRQQQDVQNIPKTNALGFDLKQKDQIANKGKRQRPDESYMHLPPTYFKSGNVPDLSIFKVPAVPAKKPRTGARKESTRESVSNFTLESLFSGSFKPPRASTPIEQPQAIISDPGDVLNTINETRIRSIQAFEQARTVEETEARKKEFMAIIDSATKKIDLCFPNIPDPLNDIIKRLNETHDIATQSPRESLCGSRSSTHNEVISKRPVPVFYEEPVNEAEDTRDLESLFNKSFASIPSVSVSRGIDDEFDISSPFKFDYDEKDMSMPMDFLFGTPSRTPFLDIGNESILMTRPTPSLSDDDNIFNWLDDSLDFCNDITDNDSNLNANIFRSPPSQRSSRYQLQRKFDQAVNTRQAFEEHNHNNSSIWSNQSIFANDDILDTTFDICQ